MDAATEADALALNQRWEEKEAARLARADRRKASNIAFIVVGGGVDTHKRHEELWFEDGNVVFISRDVHFKLHRGVVAKYSSVFRDMFQLGDASAGDSVDNCPIVNITDSPEHAVLFFTLLYDGARQPFFVDPLYPMEFQALRGLALLAFKYDVQHIQTEVIRRLRVCFPTTSDDWGHRYPHSLSRAKSDYPSIGAQDTLKFEPIDSIAVINLARRFGIRDILPIAFFICANLPSVDILTQVRYGDDELQDVEELSREDVTRCLRGRDYCVRMVLRLKTTHAATRPFDSDQCATKNARTCFKIIESQAQAHQRKIPTLSPDVFNPAVSWAVPKEPTLDSLCSSCLQDVEHKDRIFRSVVFDAWPSIFYL